MNNIIFRVDASLKIGSGHVMRCLTLANELKNNGAVIKFICRDLQGQMTDYIKQQEFDVILLSKPTKELSIDQKLSHGHWLEVDQDQDANEVIRAIGNTRPNWLVVDHYSLDYHWQQQIRPHVENIFVIDDLADRVHDCHMLLDQNFGSSADQYQSLTSDNCQIFCGAEFALLREEFVRKRPQVLVTRSQREGINNILISLGGVDQKNISLLALNSCENLYPTHKYKINLVIGAMNPHKETIKSYIKTAKQDIQLHINSNKMAHLMMDADLSIGAGGVTSWERCTLGLPAVVICLGENQRKTIDKLNAENAIIDGGDSASVTAKSLSDIICKITNDKNELKKMQTAARNICEGLGTQIIANKLQIL